MPVKNCCGGDRPLAARPVDARTGVERGEHGRQIGGGIGVRDVAADRAAVAHRRIADMRRRLGQRRALLRGRSADAASSACVVSAPIRDACRPRAMPFSSAMRPMSISAGGAASRSFSSGIRLWPPASSFAPGCCCEQRAALRRASRRGSSRSRCSNTWLSASLPGRCMARHTRSGVIGICIVSTPNGASASSTALYTVHGRRDRAGFADAFTPSGWCGDGVTVESTSMSRQHVGARHRVVEQRAGDSCPLLVVDRFFPERLADALHDAAVHLAFDDDRVDLRAAIVDARRSASDRRGRSRGSTSTTATCDAERIDEVRRVVELDASRPASMPCGMFHATLRHQRDVLDRLVPCRASP